MTARYGEGRRHKTHTLLLLGRQHPPEVTGAIAMMSFVERLMKADELASQFREQVAIVMYPLVNPDGVDKGYWRHNFQGKDLNREWDILVSPRIESSTLMSASGWNPKIITIKAIDFHSTYYDVFYTQADRSARIYPDLLGDWLAMFQEGMLEDRPDFEIRRQVSKNLSRPRRSITSSPSMVSRPPRLRLEIVRLFPK